MGKPPIKISKVVFIDLYVNQKRNGLEIAQFFGIGRTTVSRYIKRYGLEPRGISEVRKNKFWNSGEEHKKIISKIASSRIGDKHPRWKGGFYNVIHLKESEYKELHNWVRKQLGVPHRCEGCGKTGLTGRKIHWANKSGKYLRETDDWLRLCVKCHREYDKNLSY